MPSRPPLSIVCCVKNGERHLPAFGEALRAAWRPEYELVLLDDDSSDSTPRVFDSWEAEFPRVVRIHNGTSAGLGAAQVKAVAAATGDRLWIVDCDDDFPPDAPQRLLEAADRHDADVVVARARSVDGTTGADSLIDARSAPEVLDGATALRRMLIGAIEGYTWTKLYRRELFDDAPDMPQPSTQCDFVRSALALSRSSRVAVIDDVVYTYVRHGASLMDRREPPLENLVVAHDYLLGLVRTTVASSREARRETEDFTTWFLAASAIKIPVYVRADADSLAQGRSIASRAMRRVRPLAVLRVDRGVGVQAVLLKLSPRVFERTFRARVARGSASR